MILRPIPFSYNSFTSLLSSDFMNKPTVAATAADNSTT